jgi:hypothetical protein
MLKKFVRKFIENIYKRGFLEGIGVSVLYTVYQACQTEGPPRAIWVTFVLS